MSSASNQVAIRVVPMQIGRSISSSSDEAAASLIPCLVSLTATPLTRKRVTSRAVISAVGGFVRSLWAGDRHSTSSGCPSEMTRASELLQAVLETLVQPQDLLLEQGEAFVKGLLPALCTVCSPHSLFFSHFASLSKGPMRNRQKR